MDDGNFVLLEQAIIRLRQLNEDWTNKSTYNGADQYDIMEIGVQGKNTGLGFFKNIKWIWKYYWFRFIHTDYLYR